MVSTADNKFLIELVYKSAKLYFEFRTVLYIYEMSGACSTIGRD